MDHEAALRPRSPGRGLQDDLAQPLLEHDAGLARGGPGLQGGRRGPIGVPQVPRPAGRLAGARPVAGGR